MSHHKMTPIFQLRVVLCFVLMKLFTIGNAAIICDNIYCKEKN